MLNGVGCALPQRLHGAFTPPLISLPITWRVDGRWTALLAYDICCWIAFAPRAPCVYLHPAAATSTRHCTPLHATAPTSWAFSSAPPSRRIGIFFACFIAAATPSLCVGAPASLGTVVGTGFTVADHILFWFFPTLPRAHSAGACLLATADAAWHACTILCLCGWAYSLYRLYTSVAAHSPSLFATYAFVTRLCRFFTCAAVRIFPRTLRTAAPHRCFCHRLTAPLLSPPSLSPDNACRYIVPPRCRGLGHRVMLCHGFGVVTFGNGHLSSTWRGVYAFDM